MHKLEEKYAETVSAVNFSNGVVRLFFAGQDLEVLAAGESSGEPKAETRFCVVLPLPGFLYALSVVQSFVENDRFKEVVDKATVAGLLPQNSDSSAQH